MITAHVAHEIEVPHAIVSDLHIGACGPNDGFAPSLGAFLQWLSEIPQTWRLVLAGDILELWEDPLREVVGAAAPVLAMLRQRNPIYVLGNHDAALNLWERAGFVHERYCHPHVLVEHGHQADYLNRGHALLSKTASWCNGMAERMGVRLAARLSAWLMSKRAQKIGLGRWAGADLTMYLLRAAQILAEPQTCIYCFGHTHATGFWWGEEIAESTHGHALLPLLTGKLAVNLGSWVEGQQTITIIAGNSIVQGEYAEWEAMQSLVRKWGH